jgi:hypothetical protein
VITELDERLLIQREGAPYPFHHEGMHLEEKFIERWISHISVNTSNRKLIRVNWTAVYNHRVKDGLGQGTENWELRNVLKKYLDSLDRNEKYFVVCTHDDAPAEDLPPDTVVFSAGGNAKKIDVPIPLTSGPHRDFYDHMKTIPISFVGSVTHQIRYELLNKLYGKEGVVINASEWSPNISANQADLFKQIATRSTFSLCPRGYGATSYRLYESMQLGSIPVYVSDNHLLPWNDELDWEKFCVIVKPNEIDSLYNRLMSMPSKKIREMQSSLEFVWNEYFSIDASCNQIIKRVK